MTFDVAVFYPQPPSNLALIPNLRLYFSFRSPLLAISVGTSWESAFQLGEWGVSCPPNQQDSYIVLPKLTPMAICKASWHMSWLACMTSCHMYVHALITHALWPHASHSHAYLLTCMLWPIYKVMTNVIIPMRQGCNKIFYTSNMTEEKSLQRWYDWSPEGTHVPSCSFNDCSCVYYM